MKNKSLILSAVIMSVLAGCSSQPYKGEERAVASKNFECLFSDIVDGKKTQFVFTPENLKLSMMSDKGSDVVILVEDNFIAGGFSYVMDKKEKAGQWPVKKVEFISYATKPKVTVNFMRTPASKKEKTISQYCE